MNRVPETLYIKDNTGAIRAWSIGVMDWQITMQYGQLGGAMQTRFEDVPEGKASRTREQQIVSRIQSRIKKQTDAGYSFDIDDAMSRPVNALGLKKPMLAQALSKVKNINFAGAYVQPKFDGNRCVITKQQGKILAYSRNGKIIAANLDHIFIGLDLDEGDYIDGELYCHGQSLQTVVSWIKRNQADTLKLNYHVYDLMNDVPYIDRYSELVRKVNGSSVIIAPTNRVHNVGEVWELHRDFTSDGYEGAIIRWSDAGYEDGKRSKSLVKVKTFLDDEFLIKDILPSKDGWAILECWLPNYKTFRVSAPGSIAEKEYILTNSDLYIEKMVRVEYMNITKDGIPFHPIATNFIGEI